jgi:hypothetical protein
MPDKQSLSYVVKWLPLLALVAATNVAYAQSVTADAGGPYDAEENEIIELDASGSDCSSPCDPNFAFCMNGTTATATRAVFDPANNRIIVEFRDGGNVVRGATSVAVRTQ